MEVKFSNEYSVITTTYSTRTHTVTSEEILQDFISWADEDRYDDEDCLREALEEYIRDYCDLVPEKLPSSDEVEDYSTEFQLLNWSEVYPTIAFLVETPKPVTCCEKAPYGATFCPTCGNRLIKK